MSDHMLVMVVSVYAYARSGDVPKIRATNSLLEAVFDEVSRWPQLPVLLCGDLNAKISQVVPLQHAVHEGVLVDVGAHASMWDQPA
eukprot:7637550-Alexandrium_andersonii.AAC.1